jgi:phenylacetate-coenzyme A ligase PaaK-like adenylate-forming protein
MRNIEGNLAGLYSALLDLYPYELGHREKSKMLDEILGRLTVHHYSNCPEYRKILEAIGFSHTAPVPYLNLPFIPVRLFKEYELRSVQKKDVFRTMTSSGTSGQRLSMICVDRETANVQTKVLTKILSGYIGSSRLPMVVVDSPDVLKGGRVTSARAAGILGFSMFGRDRIFALNEDMGPDEDRLCEFLLKHEGKRILIFGFTFVIWNHFIKYFRERGILLDFSRAILVHGGGWKALLEEAVSPAVFKESLLECFNISEVHDYYGMIEQTGSIYMECEEGYLHASNFSDIVIRDHVDFSEARVGEEGIIQVLSVIPKSYPGHSILTEDVGVLIGIDDCRCGRRGKFFKVTGRVENAEIRGCSDTYAASD